MVLVQVHADGPWHCVSLSDLVTTSCGRRVDPAAKRRHIDLVNSGERCQTNACVAARARARKAVAE